MSINPSAAEPGYTLSIGWKLEVGVASKFIQHDKG